MSLVILQSEVRSMKIKAGWLWAILSAFAVGAPLAHGQAATPAGEQAPATTPPPVAGAADNAAPAAPAIDPEDEGKVRAAIAERFGDMAMTLAKATRYSNLGLRQSAILLEAATQMDPLEPRFWRMLAYWEEQIGDTPKAIATWKQYRNVLPDDRVAQVRLIDLYLTRLQSNDAKIKYIRELLALDSLDNVVKAHIAARAVPLLDQRSRPDAVQMLEEARKYYPLPEITMMEWQMLAPTAPTPVRFGAMLNVLNSNPTNSDAIAGVADILAENGLSERALTWYQYLMDVLANDGLEGSPHSTTNYLAERYRAGETTVANDYLDKILQKFPDRADAWFLRLTTQRSDESAQMLKQAQDMFKKRLSDCCEEILKAPLPPGVTPAPAVHIAINPPTATPPSDQVQEAIARVKQLPNPYYRENLEDALVSMTWFELYFDHKADLATPYLIAIKELRPLNDMQVRRLDGWYDLVAGNEAAARRIFTAQESQDPMAALGLFVLEDRKGHTAEANAIGAKLLARPQNGVPAAIVYQATKGRGIKPAGEPPDAEQVKKQIDEFPKEWLDSIRAPNKLYSLRAEPVKVGHRLGEPMLATITIQNESKMDICLGTQGLIKPTVLFDAQIRGFNAQTFPAVCADQLMGRLVLRPTESITQTVRIDQVGLSEALRARPAVLLLVNADVVTNAQPNEGVVRAHAGGYARNFGKMFTRNPASLAMDASRRKLFADLSNGTPESKVLDLDLLAAYYNQYMQPNATNTELTFAQQFLNFIDKSRSDPAPGVKLWSSYVYAVLTTGAEERRAVDEMMKSNSWESRLLALYACQNLPPDAAKQIAAGPAANDKDPLVKAYAAGLLEMIKNPTTKPAPAAPKTEPTTAPTAPVAPVAPAASPTSAPSTLPALEGK